MKVETIEASAFQSKCLQLIDLVEQGHAEVIVTKHGKPVAKLIAIENKELSLYGCMKDSIVMKDNNIFDTGDKWEG